MTLTEKKEAAEKIYKQNFTAWIYNELKMGKKSLITYLPFLPAVATSVYGYFKKGIEDHVSYAELFKWSILVQVVVIFCILIYQVYVFSKTEENGLAKKIKELIKRAREKPAGFLPDILFRFTQTLPIEAGENDNPLDNLRRDFKAASLNILYFKISWIILWVNWFCFYIALLMESHSDVLFDFFMITETLCFAACYYRLTQHVYETKSGELRQYWWAVIIAALLFALGIADLSTQESFESHIYTSVLKTLFGCTFLGLLIGTMTSVVQNSPNWLKILLFIYVALQPMLFGVHEAPSITKEYFTRTVQENTLDKKTDIDSLIDRQGIVYTAVAADHPAPLGNPTAVMNDFTKTFQVLEILMFNLCLAFKYLFMFYFVWLLRYDHLLIYYMRTQGDEEFVRSSREEFEKKIDELTSEKEEASKT
jgi:hypothetical protein